MRRARPCAAGASTGACAAWLDASRSAPGQWNDAPWKREAFADLVPLSLSHTGYKPYPISRVTGDRWDRLLRWVSDE